MTLYNYRGRTSQYAALNSAIQYEMSRKMERKPIKGCPITRLALTEVFKNQI